MDKQAQRNICTQRRQSLSLEERKDFSMRICERLSSLHLQGSIMSYYPFHEEADVLPFNRTMACAYPVIKENDGMDACLCEEDRFIENKYHIPEPDPEFSMKLDKGSLSAIIIPCVGFDEGLRRLGHGKGYYDRYLEDYKGLKIAVAFEAQKLAEIATDEHDISMDLIVTEKKIYGDLSIIGNRGVFIV